MLRGGGGVEGPRASPPLSLSSSCHQSPHEGNDASQQRATSDDAQHGSTGSVCQERRRMSRLNFTSCSCHVGEEEEEEERGGGGRQRLHPVQLFTAQLLR